MPNDLDKDRRGKILIQKNLMSAFRNTRAIAVTFDQFKLLALVFFTFSSSLAAEEIERNFLSGHDFELSHTTKQTEFTVSIADGVSDGCWLGASRSKSLIERELLDAGYTNILDKRVLGHLIAVDVVGYETVSARCAINLTFKLSIVDQDSRRRANVDWISLNYSDTISYSVLMTGPKTSMTERINDEISGFTDKLLVDIQQAKNAVLREISESDASEAAKEYLNIMIE